MRYLLFIATLWLSCSLCSAQTSDSLIVNQLRGKGISFSHDNSVTLLMSGQEKFDDMFQAIRQAKHSVQRPSAGDGKTVGDRKFVPAMAKAAKAFGAPGSFFEVHTDPDHGKSDAANMLELDKLEALIADLLA